MRRVFSTDPISGITRYWNHNPADDIAYLETEQDIGDLLEINKALYNDAERNWRGDMHRVANIPTTVITDLQKRGIWGAEDRMKKWLNSEEARPYRTRPGRV